MAVVPVDQSIEDGLANGFDGILRPVSAFSGLRVDDGLDLHVALAEGDGLVHHSLDGTLDPFVVQEAGIDAVMFADLGARNHHSSDGQLRQVALSKFD